jgi:hypothetical protein
MILDSPAFLPAAPRRADSAGRGAGIARMAADSPTALERNEVVYRRLPARSALNRVRGSRVSFEWSLNPYRGCEFGCVYCYARYTHEFMERRGPMAFEREIYMKEGMAARLGRELERWLVRPGETIAIGAATDPYQPAERRFGVTRSLLETLARFEGYCVEIVTKSDLVTRDLDLLKRVGRRLSDRGSGRRGRPRRRARHRQRRRRRRHGHRAERQPRRLAHQRQLLLELRCRALACPGAASLHHLGIRTCIRARFQTLFSLALRFEKLYIGRRRNQMNEWIALPG